MHDLVCIHIPIGNIFRDVMIYTNVATCFLTIILVHFGALGSEIQPAMS